MTLVAVGLFFVSPVHAQGLSIFQISGDAIPSSDVTAPDAPENTIPTNDLEAQVSTFGIAFNWPISLSDQAALVPGVSYDYLNINRTGLLAGVPGDLDLHDIGLSLLVNYRFDAQWSFALRAAPSLAGDFATLGGDYFRISATAVVFHAFSDSFKLGVGGGVSWQFGEPLPLPLIGIGWQINDNFKLDGALPGKLALTWSPSDRIEVDLSAYIQGQAYTLSSDRFRSGWPCASAPADNPRTPSIDEREASPDRCIETLAYAQGVVGPTVALRLASSIWLSVHAGYAFFRRYTFANSNNDTPDIGDLELEGDLVGRLQLEMRIPDL